MPDRQASERMGSGRRAVLAAAGAGAAALTFRRAQAAPSERLRIGMFGNPSPTAILQATGWLEKAITAKVDWVNVGSGGAFNTLAAAGGIDLGLGLGSSPAAAGLAVGIPYKVIAMCENIGGAEEMTVRKSAHIAKPQDFIGKTVAVPFGSTSNFRLAGFLTTNRLVGKVKVVYMSPTDMLAAWKRREIDAGYVWPPVKTEMLHGGGAVYETYKQLDQAGYVISNLIVMGNEVLTKHPDTAATLLRTYGRCVDVWRQNPQHAADLTAKVTGLSPTEALREMKQYDYLSLGQSLSSEWLGPPGHSGRLANVMRRTAEFLHAQKSIPSVPAVSVFANGIDTAPLARAAG